MDGAGFTANAQLGAANDTEVVGGAARRPFPLVEDSVRGDVVVQRHPLSQGTVLDDVVMDRHDAVLRRQPGYRQSAVHQLLSGHVERWIRLRSYRQLAVNSSYISLANAVSAGVC